MTERIQKLAMEVGGALVYYRIANVALVSESSLKFPRRYKDTLFFTNNTYGKFFSERMKPVVLNNIKSISLLFGHLIQYVQ